MRRVLFVVFTFLCLSLPVYAQDALPDPNCPGASVPRLVVGGRGRVSSGQSNNVRDQAGLGGTKIGQVPGDQEFTVLEGPLCLDGFNWWHVTYNDLDGWMVEGQGSEYWTSPVASDMTVIPIDNPYRKLEYPIANQLVIGAEVRLQSPTSDPLALYAEPNASAEVGTLTSGDIVTLLEDAGGWWRVEANDSLTGWLPEGFMTEGGSFFPILAPVCPYTEDRVAFIVYDNSTEDGLYTIGSDARHLCNLTYGAQSSYEAFDWSPDGQALVFSARSTGGFSCQAFTCTAVPSTIAGLYSISVDGRELRQLAEEVLVEDVAWSPDGSQIAYLQAGETNNTHDLRVINANGTGEARVLIPAKNRLKNVRWSPDGSQIATIVDIDPPGDRDFHQDILLVDVKSGKTVSLFSSDWRVESLDWSPDGRMLAASVYVDTGRNILAEIDVESGDFTEVYGTENFGGAYSPDGTQIALWKSDMQLPRSVERIDLDTGEITTLATLPGVNSRVLSWMADGAYVLVDGSGVMRVDAATGELRSLFVGKVSSIWYPPQVQPSG